jgi:hypothetical protein
MSMDQYGVSQFGKFVEQVGEVLTATARGKGYIDEWESKPGGALFDLIESVCPGHPIGEIIYKAIRYRSKEDPGDLVKIAAWAYLVWSRTKAAGPSVRGDVQMNLKPEVDPGPRLKRGEE